MEDSHDPRCLAGGSQAHGEHTHRKPLDLQGELISAVSDADDIVIDPAAGSFSVMEACKLRGRNFLGLRPERIMAPIKDAKGRLEGSGYSRLFDDNDLGHLISRVQSAVISSGTELERLIKEKVQTISDLDEFLEQEIMPDGVRVAAKKESQEMQNTDFAGAEPDFLIFKRSLNKQACHLVELRMATRLTPRNQRRKISLCTRLSARTLNACTIRYSSFLLFQSGR